jgi:hypothetical protein
VSTVDGLGPAGYISTSYLNNSLASTTKGVNDNFGSFGYISALTLQSSLQSTTKGVIDSLGSFGYISTPSLNSTLQSTVQGITNYLGSFGYVSTQTMNSTLTSTIVGLGTLGYVSTATLNAVLISTTNAFNLNSGNLYISTASLTSTTQGLGTFGYISVASLVSTTSSLINVLSTGAGNKVSIRSSVMYEGCNGTFQVQTIPGFLHMFFTTARINMSNYSNYITATSRISIDVNENILFPGSAGATSNGVGNLRFISTNIQAAQTTFTNTLFSDPIILQFSNLSNSYVKNLTIPLDATEVMNSYTSTLIVNHFVSSGIYIAGATNAAGFNSSTITVSNSFTNSIFVTILN